MMRDVVEDLLQELKSLDRRLPHLCVAASRGVPSLLCSRALTTLSSPAAPPAASSRASHPSPAQHNTAQPETVAKLVNNVVSERLLGGGPGRHRPARAGQRAGAAAVAVRRLPRGHAGARDVGKALATLAVFVRTHA